MYPSSFHNLIWVASCSLPLHSEIRLEARLHCCELHPACLPKPFQQSSSKDLKKEVIRLVIDMSPLPVLIFCVSFSIAVAEQLRETVYW